MSNSRPFANFLAVVLVTFSTCTLASAQQQLELNPKPEAKSEVASKITSAILSIEKINPPNLLVEASAEFPSGGYSNFVLSRVEYVTPPKDGIQDYYFYATPPSGPATTAITTEKASNRWIAYPDWVKGVRIHGVDKGILVKRLGRGKPPAIQTIYQPKEGVTKFSVSGRSTLFRLSASTISGGTISEPTIKGPAKLVRTANVVTVGQGGPMIGTTNKEFVFRSTGAGKVTIQIRSTVPTSPMPKLEEYVITIQ